MDTMDIMGTIPDTTAAEALRLVRLLDRQDALRTRKLKLKVKLLEVHSRRLRRRIQRALLEARMKGGSDEKGQQQLL